MLHQPKIGAIVFYVKDIDRAEKFYRDVLGLKTTVRPGHGGEGEAHDKWMIAETGTCSLIFFRRDEPVGRSPIVVFELEQGGIDDVVEQLAGRGVRIVTPVSEAPGGWTADVVDPDNHMLSLYQYDKAPRRMKK